MELILIDITGKRKLIGDVTDNPVPSIGDAVFVGYSNPPHVTDVVWDYFGKRVLVYLDSSFFD